MIIYSFDLEEACTINSQLLRITFDVQVLHITVEGLTSTILPQESVAVLSFEGQYQSFEKVCM